MKHSSLLFSALMLGSVVTISGQCVPNLQYHKQVHATHTHSDTSPKSTSDKATASIKKDVNTAEKKSSQASTTQQDLKNPMSIQDGSAEEFP